MYTLTSAPNNWTITDEGKNCSAITLIPDTNFEQYLIDANIDSDGTINGEVFTTDIENVTQVSATGRNITDLTGIQDFTNLETLRVFDNALTSLDVSQNLELKDLRCFNNQITELDVTNNTKLEDLRAFDNSIETDMSFLGDWYFTAKKVFTPNKPAPFFDDYYVLATPESKKIYQLIAGKDINKDQSYFLCQLSQEQLTKALFPIGELTKPEVREIAKKANLITADKKDSQGLCFIGKVRLPEFLQQKLQPKEGVIITIPADFEQYTKRVSEFENKEAELNYFSTKFSYRQEDGKVVGKHQGAHYYTKGQRKGLNVGGTKEALYVIETDVLENVIYTGEGKNHKGLYRSVLFVSNEELHWIRTDLALDNGEHLKVKARIRYRQALEEATLYKVETGLFVEFANKQSAITEGQFVAWYINEELLGSGVIA